MTESKLTQMTNEEKCWTVAAALSKRGYTSHYASDKAAAKELALSLIPAKATIGFGGSGTTRALGLVEALRENGHAIYDHWQAGQTPEEILTIRRQQVVSDVFFTSANALTIEGEIVNVDGFGNRVAGAIFGPSCVIMIVGVNKITADLSEALERSRQVAGVQRAKQMNVSTPCTITGECSDCSSPARICNVTSIQHRKPGGSIIKEYHVIVIPEEIGL